MRRQLSWVGLVLLSGVSLLSRADGLSIVSSIPPIHSIVQSVVGDRGSASLLLEGSSSPHHFALKPSHARQLQAADALILVDFGLESFLKKPVASLPNLQVVELSSAPGLRLFESREVGVLNPESSNGHTHDHANHDHETQDDLHLWLDPENGVAMAAHLAEIFATLDPAGADLYQANFQQFRKQMTLQIKRLKARLTPYREKPYVVFHDAYQYFEKRFDLKAPGVLTLNPEMAASAKVVQELRVYIQQHNVRCAFREPQFSSAILESLIEGLDVDIGIFDPLGASGVRGVALYPQIIEGMADAFEQCVSRD